MEFIKPGTNINFVGNRYYAFALSGATILLSIIMLIVRGGPNYGVDFTGGVVIQVKLDKQHSPSDIRQALEGTPLQNSIIQEFGEKGRFEYLIRPTNPDLQTAGLGDIAKQALSAKFGQGVDIRQVEMVGPQVGQDMRNKALLAIFYSILLIAVYISGRFEMKWVMSGVMAAALFVAAYVAYLFNVSVVWLIVIAIVVTVGLCSLLRLKWALGAIISLIHDITVVVGAFAITDREISLTVIAAFLTILGYSLNDTIIVYDRIRENLGKSRKQSLGQLMNKAINETLSRTILTSSTVIIVVLFLFLFGGTVIHDFAFAMLIGVITGTWSSVFVASPILLFWESEASRTMKVRKT
jgi:preprotein translocase subunit SecF